MDNHIKEARAILANESDHRASLVELARRVLAQHDKGFVR